MAVEARAGSAGGCPAEKRAFERLQVGYDMGILS